MTKSRLDRTPNSDVREMEEIDLLELFRAILKYIEYNGWASPSNTEK